MLIEHPGDRIRVKWYSMFQYFYILGLGLIDTVAHSAWHAASDDFICFNWVKCMDMSAIWWENVQTHTYLHIRVEHFPDIFFIDLAGTNKSSFRYHLYLFAYYENIQCSSRLSITLISCRKVKNYLQIQNLRKWK